MQAQELLIDSVVAKLKMESCRNAVEAAAGLSKLSMLAGVRPYC
jgi:hypothetical protein